MAGCMSGAYSDRGLAESLSSPLWPPTCSPAFQANWSTNNDHPEDELGSGSSWYHRASNKTKEVALKAPDAVDVLGVVTPREEGASEAVTPDHTLIHLTHSTQ